MASLLPGTRARSCAPCTTKRPAGSGTRSSRLALTQSLASTLSKTSVAAISRLAALVTSSRNRLWSGASAKCTVTSQRPSGRSNAAIAASPSKKIWVSTSTTRLAACSSPIAKEARWVAGVRFIGPQLAGGKYRPCLQASLPDSGRIFTASSPCSECGRGKRISRKNPSETRAGAQIATGASTAYPALIHRRLLAFHRRWLVNIQCKAARGFIADSPRHQVGPAMEPAIKRCCASMASQENKRGDFNDKVRSDARFCARACRLCRHAQGERAAPHGGGNAVAVDDDAGHAFASGGSLRRRLSKRTKTIAARS